MSTHYYNYEEFENPSEDFDYRMVISEIPEDDTTGIKSLNEFVQSVEIDVSSSHFLIEETDEVVPHKLYYIIARQGSGNSFSVADSAYVRYKGITLDDVVFDDNNYNVPLWFNLPSLQSPSTSLFQRTYGARGFSEGISLFKTGLPPVENADGSYEVEEFGVGGVIIFPSGLGYYSYSAGSLASYQPMIFNVEVLASRITDHDADGTLSSEEDTNGDGYLYNDDADEDGLVDYLDSDTN